MRILHTSDWHLGRKLYDYPLLEEQEKFLSWLIHLIKTESIDLLVVAGDVFDSALPAGDVTRTYYQFLYDLHKKCSIPAVIVAGNHDSSPRLTAPREFLAVAGIHIYGYTSKDPADYLLSIKNDKETLYVAAIPYIPEGDILSHVSFEDSIERSQRYRIAVSNYYYSCFKKVSKSSSGVPCIAVGHFFIQGGKMGQSERVINIGGTQPLCKDDLPGEIGYYALGHLHRPQVIGGHHKQNDHSQNDQVDNDSSIIYSGSPLPLTFKEAKYDKKVYIHDTEKPRDNQGINVPTFRELHTAEGTLKQILQSIDERDWQGKLIEVNLIIDEPVPGASDTIRDEFDRKGGNVLAVQAVLPHTTSDMEMASDFDMKSPKELFVEMYQERYEKDPDDQLTATFAELLDMYNNSLEGEED